MQVMSGALIHTWTRVVTSPAYLGMEGINHQIADRITDGPTFFRHKSYLTARSGVLEWGTSEPGLHHDRPNPKWG
jgi:hypothetical protein